MVIILLLEFLPGKAPETVYIRVLKPDNKTPEVNALCKADISSDNRIINDFPLEKVNNMPIDCYKGDCKNLSKGYYMLNTNLNGYRGKFEIKIVCVTKDSVSYKILNNTHIPCEIKDNGKSVRCTN